MTRTADQILDDLCDETGSDREEMVHFINQVSVFTKKGLSLDEALEKGKQVWLKAIDQASKLTRDQAAEIVTEVFFPSAA